MSRGLFYTVQQLATAVWSLVAVGSRTVTAQTVQDKTGYSLSADQAVDTTKWRGAIPNVLISGRVDARASVVGDKTGYSLSAGSYSVIKSIQNGSGSISGGSSTANVTISAVTTSKAFVFWRSLHLTDSANAVWTVTLTSSTNVQINRNHTSGTSQTVAFTVVEFF